MVGFIFISDNFRVLPYGRENADFLNFEQRRNLRAGTFIFHIEECMVTLILQEIESI
jgi:hypothetical protein